MSSLTDYTRGNRWMLRVSIQQIAGVWYVNREGGEKKGGWDRGQRRGATGGRGRKEDERGGMGGVRDVFKTSSSSSSSVATVFSLCTWPTSQNLSSAQVRSKHWCKHWGWDVETTLKTESLHFSEVFWLFELLEAKLGVCISVGKLPFANHCADQQREKEVSAYSPDAAKL